MDEHSTPNKRRKTVRFAEDAIVRTGNPQGLSLPSLSFDVMHLSTYSCLPTPTRLIVPSLAHQSKLLSHVVYQPWLFWPGAEDASVKTQLAAKDTRSKLLQHPQGLSTVLPSEGTSKTGCCFIVELDALEESELNATSHRALVIIIRDTPVREIHSKNLQLTMQHSLGKAG